MDWDQTNSRGNWLDCLIRPSRRTVENSWNCPLLKERSNKEETGFKESKRLRPIGQTNRPCSPCHRQGTKRRKRGGGQIKGIHKWGPGGWETGVTAIAEQTNGLERARLQHKGFGGEWKAASNSPLPASASIVLAPIASPTTFLPCSFL